MRESISKTARQIKLLFGSFTLRDLLTNRIVLVIILALVISGSVQAFASMNNDGNISGYVTNTDGEPVAGANVVIQKLTIRSQAGGVNTTTNESGYYEFTNQTDVLEFRLSVTKEGYESTEIRRHLYFKGQNQQINVILNESG